MSVEDLMARIDEARNRNQEAKGVLSAAASGAAKGISVGVTMEWSRISRQAADLASKVREAQGALRNLPPAPGTKTYAGVEGRKPILSGNSRPDLVNQVEARAARMNPELFRGNYRDNKIPGRHFFTHAEKQVSEAYPNRPIGVSKSMCDGSRGNCVNYFKELATHRNKIQVVADPEKTRAFYPDTYTDDNHIEEFPNNISDQDLSRRALEATTRPIKEQGGLSATLMNGLENTHIRRGLKALGPVSALMDAYSLKEAYDTDGGKIGENVKSTAGGIAVGWAGAATGAAIGTAIAPGVGTVIGGIVGGIAGGAGGELLGKLF